MPATDVQKTIFAQMTAAGVADLFMGNRDERILIGDSGVRYAKRYRGDVLAKIVDIEYNYGLDLYVLTTKAIPSAMAAYNKGLKTKQDTYSGLDVEQTVEAIKSFMG